MCQYNIQATEGFKLWEFSWKMRMLRQKLFSHIVTVQGMQQAILHSPKPKKLVWIKEYIPVLHTFLLLLHGYSFFFVSDLDVTVFIIFPAVREGKTNSREV